MTQQVTPDLKVTAYTKANATPTTPRKITFKLQPQADLWLGILTVAETTGSSITPALNPGTPTHSGTGTLNVPTAIFSALWDFLGQPHLVLDITYDDVTFLVANLVLFSQQSLMAVGSASNSVSASTPSPFASPAE